MNFKIDAFEQSVTDEDVREAIEQLECDVQRVNTPTIINEEDGDIWEVEPGAEHMREQLTKCYNLAITALRAYRPQEPCEFCEGKKYLSGSAFLEDGQVELSIEHGDFNFCPNCGRKIESED